MKTNQKIGTLLLMLALSFPTSASVRADGVEGRAGVDFVHAPSVFDSCFHAYMTIARLFHRVDLLPGEALDARRQTVVARTPFAPSPNPYYPWEAPLLGSPQDFLPQYEVSPEDDQILRRLRDGSAAYTSDTTYDMEADKRRLVRQMEAYRDTAALLPLVFADVGKRFAGSIPDYVDTLYAHSAMTDKRYMRRLLRRYKQRRKRMQADMGFQFALSKQLYRAWEAQGCPAEGVGRYVIRNEWRTPAAEH